MRDNDMNIKLFVCVDKYIQQIKVPSLSWTDEWQLEFSDIKTFNSVCILTIQMYMTSIRK